jgi:hypothetical protein
MINSSHGKFVRVLVKLNINLGAREDANVDLECSQLLLDGDFSVADPEGFGGHRQPIEIVNELFET